MVGQIGEGAFGLVYYARGPQNRVCAIKTFKTYPKDPPVVPAPTTIREVHLLRDLSHENVLNLLHVQVNHAELALSLVFDYAEHDLNRVLRHHRDARKGAPIPLKMVKSIAWQITRGLAYLHGARVAHRDLKPENILIMGDGLERGLIKIADFGLARKIDTLARPLDENGPVVTLWYRAPELLLGAKYHDEAIDAWAAGAIFGELATLAPLFRGVEAPGAGARRDMYDRSQLEKIFATLGVPKPETRNQKPEKDTAEKRRRVIVAGRGASSVLAARGSRRIAPRCARRFPASFGGGPEPRVVAEPRPRALPLRPAAKAQRRGRADAPVLRGNARAVAQRIRRGRGNAGGRAARRMTKIKSADEPRFCRERRGGDAAPAPRGAAGEAALNAVRSYGDLRR